MTWLKAAQFFSRRARMLPNPSRGKKKEAYPERLR
jgi:hypothetical protein